MKKNKGIKSSPKPVEELCPKCISKLPIVITKDGTWTAKECKACGWAMVTKHAP